VAAFHVQASAVVNGPVERTGWLWAPLLPLPEERPSVATSGDVANARTGYSGDEEWYAQQRAGSGPVAKG
jgi:hypothetical protein